MAKRIDKEKAISLRLQGKTYSEIRKNIVVSKSTLSLWLQHLPLSREQLVLVRDKNPRRIESYVATMRVKREARIAVQADKARQAIGKLTKRDILIAGFFLFWGEGSKGRTRAVVLTNTDPAMLRFFIAWLKTFDIDIKKLRCALHLYSDMSTEQEIRWWSSELGIPPNQFRTYTKASAQANISYKNGFGHGTCSVQYGNQQMNDFVRTGLNYIRKLYGGK
jgi:hypothetical protein